MRLFCSLPLPDDVRARIAAAVPCAPGFSWTRPEQLHFTLAFLGEQPRAPEVALANRAFELAIEGSGAFPSAKRPRVLWLGVTEGAAQLTALAEALAAQLRAQSIELDARPFRPHLTLARARGPATMPALPAHALARFRATHVDLVQSHLGAGGARHETLKRIPLLD